MNYTTNENDYYGQFIEVLFLEYHGLPIKRITCVKCEQFDPTLDMGAKVHRQYKLLEVNHKQSFDKHEPFIDTV